MTLVIRCLMVLIFLSVSGNTIAQSDTTVYQINWQKPVKLVIQGKYVEILDFYLSDHKSENNYLPSYNLVVKDVYSTQAELFNVEWVALTEQDLKTVPSGFELSTEPKVLVFNSVERKRPNTKVEIIPFRRSASGIVEKIAKFQIKLFPESAPVTNQSPENVQRRMSAVSGSVLSQGDWYKMAFPSTGIYKIDYKYIKSLGLNPESINIQNLQIWGNGGGMLPEANAAIRKEDLSETPVYIEDGNDGKFDEGDFILFYVQGPDIWKKVNSRPYYEFSKNLYSNHSYYFLTIGNNSGKRILKDSPVNNVPDLVLSTYSARYHHEKDNVNFLSSGRRWYGEEFSNNLEQEFSVPVNGISSRSAIHVSSSLMNRSSQYALSNTFNLFINNVPFKTYTLYGGGNGVYDKIGNNGDYIDSIPSANFTGLNSLKLKIRYNKNGGLGTGFLNFVTFNYEDLLSLKTNYLEFRNLNSAISGTVQYNLAFNGPAAVRIWDITDLSDIREPQIVKESNAVYFNYVADTTTVREFIAFTGTEFPFPSPGSKVKNQNLHAEPTPDYIIITHPDFKNAADVLADFRREFDKLEVLVATTEEIYNEFSSGAQDLVALRDFSRMFYKRTDGLKLKYLLLFGDCSFDYRNIKRLPESQSFVPVYESPESLFPTETFSSDDYVGLLDDNEGTWGRYENDDMDIGVGRLPVKTLEEGYGVVQKIKHYCTNPSTLGAWRQNLTFIADNEDGNIFLENAEFLSNKSEYIRSNYNTKKIYLAAYNHDQGRTPQANYEIEQEFNNGTFIMNYIGHGGERQLASENVINISTISALNNIDRLPFMVAATCDFGKYDDPGLTSGGELLMIKSNGGSIGVLCTTRPVYQNYNSIINDKFYETAFPADNKFLKLGELIRVSKNKSMSSIYNRNFALLGDPALQLAYPQNQISITKVNGKDFVPNSDTLKAQSKVTFTGNIVNNGAILTDFNGVINVLVFDKGVIVQTVESPKAFFEVKNSKIFNGSATVKNGEFTFTFIVPKNINYIVGNGKISLYANVEDGRLVDASTGDSRILVGGADKNAVADNTPPQVKAYLNDESFVQGGITNENPLLIVKLFDESGISSISDVGGSITAVVNNKIKEEKDLSSFYKSDRDTYKSGTIQYRLSDLNEGYNMVKIKAFDTNNNGLENGGLIEFNVAQKGNLTIKNLLNYPNPFTTNTIFHFDHNRAGDDLEMMLQVYTVTGKLVKTLTLHTPAAKSHVSDFVWDGKDDFGDNIGRGVYVYKLSVKALSDGYKKDEYQRLVILN